MRCFFILSIFANITLSQYVYALQNNYFGSTLIESSGYLSDFNIAFHLNTNDISSFFSSDSSYVILNETALFPKIGTVQVDDETIDIGPRVQSGWLTDTDFYLELEPFTNEVAGKEVTRKVTLSGVPDAEQKTITGDYTEVMTGYLREPITVSGTFTLYRPVSTTPEDLSGLLGAIRILQICAGYQYANIDMELDYVNDNQLDIKDVIHVLQSVSANRE